MDGYEANATAALEALGEWQWLRCDPDGVPFHPGKGLNWVVNRLAMEGVRRPQEAILTLLCQGALTARGDCRWQKYQDFGHFQTEAEGDQIHTRHWQRLAKSIQASNRGSGWGSSTEAQIQLTVLGLKDCPAYEWDYGSCRFTYADVTDNLSPFDDDYMEEWFSAWEIEVWPRFLNHPDAEPEADLLQLAAPKDQGGAPRKWDWDGALVHLAALAHFGTDGLLRSDGGQPNQSDIARHLQGWFTDTAKDAPEFSQLRAYGKRFIMELNALKLKAAKNLEPPK